MEMLWNSKLLLAAMNLYDIFVTMSNYFYVLIKYQKIMKICNSLVTISNTFVRIQSISLVCNIYLHTILCCILPCQWVWIYKNKSKCWTYRCVMKSQLSTNFLIFCYITYFFYFFLFLNISIYFTILKKKLSFIKEF